MVSFPSVQPVYNHSSDDAVRMIGYGALKIMSDKDIKDFRSKYIDYLKNEMDINAKGNELAYGFVYDSIHTAFGAVAGFLNYLQQEDIDYYSDIFLNLELKVSNCNGKNFICQGWSGNSGSGIFDEKGNIIGIYTRAMPYIGGKRHAGNNDWWFNQYVQLSSVEEPDSEE